MPKIQYIPFQYTHSKIRMEMVDTFKQCYDNQEYILGSGLLKFEEEYASYSDTKYAIGVGNGHDALLIILKSLGIGPGDEVIIPAHTFIATALSVVNAGATPVLVDVDEKSFNINPRLLEKNISMNSRAIVPVHIYGNPCEMDSIIKIARHNNLDIIEDNAQAHGAAYKSQKTGSMGIMNFTSFYPTKNLGALGDGGMITTNSQELRDKAKSFRNYGKSVDGSFVEIGINSRLDDMQACLLSQKLVYLNKWNDERREIACLFESELKGVEEISFQITESYSKCVYHIFPILSDKRNELKKYLKSRGIDTLIHYEKPIHLHESFAFLNQKRGNFPVAEKISATQLSLPIYPGLTKEQVKFICDQIKSFYTNN